MTYDPATRIYHDAHLAKGWTRNSGLPRPQTQSHARSSELLGRCAVPHHSDLRPTRQAKNITLTQVAQHFGVWPMHISTIERGTRRNDELATAYRRWLTAA